MWIYIPVSEDGEPWVGKITAPTAPRAYWEMDAIRHVSVEDLYDATPFSSQTTVIAFLDHQLPCTLIAPFVRSVDPGKLGVRYTAARSVLKVEFQALLRQIAIENSEEKKFRGISFESPAYGAWFSPPHYQADFDPNTRTHSVDIKPTERSEFSIDLGDVVSTVGVSFARSGSTGTLRSAANFRLNFNELQSLQSVRELCSALERLFGFLIGHRGKSPIFKVWTDETYRVGTSDLTVDGTLELSGFDWQEENSPDHPLRCVHLNGLGGITPQEILDKFLSNRVGLETRMSAVEFCRHFSTNISDKLSVIMPILEEYLKRTYTAADESEYIAERDNFFAYVDASPSEDVRNFCKKHIQLKDKKEPSLKVLLSRAIESVNAAGFSIDPSYAERLQRRRGRLFHSAPDFTPADVRNFFDEVRAATLILMLHTYRDLGIDISCLADRWSALGDFWGFFVDPAPSDRNVNALEKA